MQSTYILHSRPFQDSSAILDCLTIDHGLVSLVARGVKRPRSKFYGLIQPFILLQMAWVGRGELKTLTQAEAGNLYPALNGQKIMVGLYLNELLLRLLQRADPHPQLFIEYDTAIQALGVAVDPIAEQILLRRFELKLLTEIGYAIDLTRDCKTHEAIVPDLLYRYDPQSGLVEASSTENSSISVSGASIIALQNMQFDNESELREAKKLMRTIFSFYLGNKPLNSRKMFHAKSE